MHAYPLWLATEEAQPYAVRLPEAQQVLERIADALAGPVQRRPH